MPAPCGSKHLEVSEVLGLKRSRKVPSELKAKFDRDERLVASASTVDDSGTVVVTTLGLWLPGRDRLGWHQIHKATWSGSRLTVIPGVPVSESESEGYVVMADDDAIVVNLAKPEDLPAEVRERVTKSVAYTAHHDLPGGGVRVVGRRVPGVNGVSWFVRYDEGTDSTDPEVVAFTEGLVAEASQPHPE
jgi:hypothetical protein